MSIGSAIQKGNYVYIYDDTGRQVSMIQIPLGATLLGYTVTTINIRSGIFAITYNARGQQIAQIQAFL